MPKKKSNLPKGRKPTNEHQKRKYAERRSYITEANRRKKRVRHMKNHPNDLQTRKLVDSSGS